MANLENPEKDLVYRLEDGGINQLGNNEFKRNRRLKARVDKLRKQVKNLQCQNWESLNKPSELP